MKRHQGKRTEEVLRTLQRYESRNVTYVDPDGSWPIVWEEASGCHVRDAEGRRYLDLTAAFGVAAAGHANRAVVRAGQRQMGHLLHAMGDVHPHALKAQLARELSRLTFERWRGPKRTGKTVFCNSGFEAVEVALKTARLATGKPGVIAFEGSYHGLGYGTLNVTHRVHFRESFRNQLREFASFVPYPLAQQGDGIRSAKGQLLTSSLKEIRRLLRSSSIGAVLVEPVQARGGIQVPPPTFLQELRALCDRHDVLLIVDEIYTGFGRTGRWFACEHGEVTPDLICLGKALSGGFPLSACVGRADVMDAWPSSSGEAIHTSTFLGHPVGCAMALAQIEEIERRQLIRQSERKGSWLLGALGGLSHSTLQLSARGLGLMAGVELRTGVGAPATAASLQLIKRLLHRGFLFLPEGEHANIIAFTPPLTITETQLRQAVEALDGELSRWP